MKTKFSNLITSEEEFILVFMIEFLKCRIGWLCGFIFICGLFTVVWYVTELTNLFNQNDLYLPIFIILAGLLVLGLLVSLLYYALKAKERADDLEKAVQELRRANATLAEQDKLVSLGTLTAGIAHEVKNPLNIMKSFSELSVSLVEEVLHTLKKYIDLFNADDKANVCDAMETLHTNLVRICEQSKRANNTIQRMLAHSRTNQELVLTDINGLLDEYLNLSYYGIRAQDPTFNIKITKRYDVNAPKINIVAEDMGRVFLNLFNNAYYALAQKKKKEGSRFYPELIVTTIVMKDRFEVRIRDNGGGIPESVRDKIFTPFFTTKPVGMGTGLGLSLSHSVINDQKGTLDFVSKEGDFTEFHISLPIGL